MYRFALPGFQNGMLLANQTPTIDYANMDASQIAPLVKGNQVRQQEYLASIDAQIQNAGAWGRSPEEAAERYKAIRDQLVDVTEANPDELVFNGELSDRIAHIDALLPPETKNAAP